MIRRYVSLLRAMLMAADAAVAIALVVIVYLLRFGTITPPKGVVPLESGWAGVLLYALLWVTILYLSGEYRLRARWTLRSEVTGIARATVWLALLTLSVLFLSNQPDISRLFLLLLFPIQGLVTIATRAALRWCFMFVRRRGRNVRNMLILGTGPRAREFAHLVHEHSAFGVSVVGFLGDPPQADGAPAPYLGDIASILKVMHERVIDEVAICLPRSEWGQLEEVIRFCQEEGKILRVPLDAPHIELGLRIVEDLDGTAVLSVIQGPEHLLSLALKRVLDVVGAGLALLLLAPLLLAVALHIRVRDGSPVLFRQTRIGMHGRPFTILKFRTMVRDAEHRFHEVAHRNETRGAAFKMSADPRVTTWGRFLRRASIDELPQLWNVLWGDMSLVGPRPAPPREVDAYDLWHRRRLSMKPGMTGLWQVTSRIDEDFDERARLDLDYIDRWSLWLDLRIVARTVPAVFRPDGR